MCTAISFRAEDFYFGRTLDYAVALEGSLKLKEISYIHSEAYAAGELKHGTIALIEPGTVVIALCSVKGLYDKMLIPIFPKRQITLFIFLNAMIYLCPQRLLFLFSCLHIMLHPLKA